MSSRYTITKMSRYSLHMTFMMLIVVQCTVPTRVVTRVGALGLYPNLVTVSTQMDRDLFGILQYGRLSLSVPKWIATPGHMDDTYDSWTDRF